MPTVDVDLNDSEFDLLADWAVRHGATVQDALRYAAALMLRAEECAGIADRAVEEVLGKDRSG